eukprot:COSAG02_NODE_4184_length_5655_cov_2.189885_7_plen_37_part_00
MAMLRNSVHVGCRKRMCVRALAGGESRDDERGVLQR